MNNPEDNDHNSKPTALVFCAGQEFLKPYVEREFSGYRVFFEPQQEFADGRPELAVMISSTDIYDVGSGMNHSEDTALRTSSPFYGYEQMWRDRCSELGVPCTILRAANVVGTGMNGFPMELARGIARGTLMHIQGNESVLSTVHAVDVARIAHELANSGEVVNVTDGTNTTVDALTDALAYRIDDKRVYTTKARWARWLLGKSMFKRLTTTLTFSNARLLRLLPDEQMNTVTEYLRTHVYDHDSL